MQTSRKILLVAMMALTVIPGCAWGFTLDGVHYIGRRDDYYHQTEIVVAKPVFTETVTEADK